jgi:FkbM family methyltransferase
MVADRAPVLARGALWLWVNSSQWLKKGRATGDHWLVAELAHRLEGRIPVHTRLGNGMKIKVHLNDHVGGAIIRTGFYEIDTVRLIRRLLKPGMIFFDVGTHVGQYTLLASESVGPSGEVHGFEPDPETYRWFASNVRRNRLANVHTNQLALAGQPGKLTLYLSAVTDIGSNSLRRPRSFSGREVEVEVVTLDGYIGSRRVPRVDVMKIDVEGAECEVLNGASTLLGREDRPVMILEFEEARQAAFQSSCAQLTALLVSKGYNLFRFDSSTVEPYVPAVPDKPSFNILAVPENRIEIVAELRGLP